VSELGLVRGRYRREEAEVDRFVGETGVEAEQSRAVLGTDGAKVHGRAVREHDV